MRIRYAAKEQEIIECCRVRYYSKLGCRRCKHRAECAAIFLKVDQFIDELKEIKKYDNLRNNY